MISVNRPDFIAGKQSRPPVNQKLKMATKTEIRADFKNAEVKGSVTQSMIGKILNKVVDKMELNSLQKNAITSQVNRLVNTEFNSAVNQAIDPVTNTFDQTRIDNETTLKCHGKTPDPRADADACIMDICGSNEKFFNKQGINEMLLLNELRGAVADEVLDSMLKSKDKPTKSPSQTQVRAGSPTTPEEIERYLLRLDE